MATLLPAGISPNMASLPLGLQREWAVVLQLQAELPDDWLIFTMLPGKAGLAALCAGGVGYCRRFSLGQSGDSGSEIREPGMGAGWAAKALWRHPQEYC